MGKNKVEKTTLLVLYPVLKENKINGRGERFNKIFGRI
jgi:hypothetical protein